MASLASEQTGNFRKNFWRFCMKTLSYYNDNPFNLLDQFISNANIGYENFRSPTIDVREEQDRYVLIAELPGLNEKDIKLEMKDDILSISTEIKKEEENGNTIAWIRKERKDFRFSRSFGLPEDVNRDMVEAKFRDGLLTIALPKKPETAPRIVPVNVA
jgi:HSP20 family protein